MSTFRLMTADDVGGAVAAVSALPPSEPATAAARRAIAKRARALGASHLVPKQWLQPQKHPKAVITATAAPHPEPLGDDPISILAEETNLSVKALRTAYMRGVRDYAMISPHLRPPLSRDTVAMARVTALIRRVNGDPTARSDDEDLLVSEEGRVDHSR